MPNAQSASLLTNMVPLIFIFIIFYFLLIRPQQKERKLHQKMLEGLAKNDEVVTSSGIHGTIVNVKEKTIILRIDDAVKVEIEKNCVSLKKKTQS